MIISSKVARERLSSDLNRLRDGAASHGDNSPDTRVEIPEGDARDRQKPRNPPASIEGTPAQDAGRDEEEQPVRLSDLVGDLADREDEVLDFTSLDKLIDLDPMEDRTGQGHGKRRYRNNIEAQTAIGEVATLTTQQTAAHLFGISQAQTHAYDNAASSSNHVARGQHKPDLKARLDSFRELLAAKAAIRLHETLDCLNGEKLASVKKATNLSRIAKDMATVMRNVEERLDRRTSESVIYHMYHPEMAKEEDYEVVEATITRHGVEEKTEI